MVSSASCPHCQKAFAINPKLSGRSVKCSRCGGKFRMPEQTLPPPIPPAVPNSKRASRPNRIKSNTVAVALLARSVVSQLGFSSLTDRSIRWTPSRKWIFIACTILLLLIAATIHSAINRRATETTPQQLEAIQHTIDETNAFVEKSQQENVQLEEQKRINESHKAAVEQERTRALEAYKEAINQSFLADKRREEVFAKIPIEKLVGKRVIIQPQPPGKIKESPYSSSIYYETGKRDIFGRNVVMTAKKEEILGKSATIEAVEPIKDGETSFLDHGPYRLALQIDGIDRIHYIMSVNNVPGDDFEGVCNLDHFENAKKEWQGKRIWLQMRRLMQMDNSMTGYRTVSVDKYSPATVTNVAVGYDVEKPIRIEVALDSGIIGFCDIDPVNARDVLGDYDPLFTCRDDVKRAIRRETVTVGMNSDEVHLSVGMPDHVNRTTNVFGTTEQRVYRGPRLMYVYLEADIVKSIQE